MFLSFLFLSSSHHPHTSFLSRHLATLFTGHRGVTSIYVSILNAFIRTLHSFHSSSPSSIFNLQSSIFIIVFFCTVSLLLDLLLCTYSSSSSSSSDSLTQRLSKPCIHHHHHHVSHWIRTLSSSPEQIFIFDSNRIITITITIFPIVSEPYHHHLSKFSFLIQTVSSTSSLLFQFWSLPYPPTHLCCFVFDSAHSPFVFFFFRFCFFAFSWLLNLFPSCSLWQFIHQGSMETESESSPELPILFIGVALVLGLLCRHLLKGTRIPYTGALLVLGIAMGAAGIWHILMNVKEMNSFWCIYLWEET